MNCQEKAGFVWPLIYFHTHFFCIYHRVWVFMCTLLETFFASSRFPKLTNTFHLQELSFRGACSKPCSHFYFGSLCVSFFIRNNTFPQLLSQSFTLNLKMQAFHGSCFFSFTITRQPSVEITFLILLICYSCLFIFPLCSMRKEKNPSGEYINLSIFCHILTRSLLCMNHALSRTWTHHLNPPERRQILRNTMKPNWKRIHYENIAQVLPDYWNKPEKKVNYFRSIEDSLIKKSVCKRSTSCHYGPTNYFTPANQISF